MKAYEQKKDVKSYGNDRVGIICIIIEGDKQAVMKVCAVLDKEYKNDMCPDDNGEYGYSEGYYIDRNEKAEFMAAYKQAKKGVI